MISRPRLSRQTSLCVAGCCTCPEKALPPSASVIVNTLHVDVVLRDAAVLQYTARVPDTHCGEHRQGLSSRPPGSESCKHSAKLRIQVPVDCKSHRNAEGGRDDGWCPAFLTDPFRLHLRGIYAIEWHAKQFRGAGELFKVCLRFGKSAFL